jgi:hypothetical protein
MPPTGRRPSRRLDRRAFLRAGLGALTLPGLLRLRAAAGPTRREPTAVIVLFCYGGMSHLDLYDPKPEAPAEYRGPFAPVATRVPGMRLSELLPRHAAVADRFGLLRSLAHEASCHANGPQMLMTGHYTPRQSWYPEHPDCLAVTNYLRWRPGRAVPNYVGLTTAPPEPGPVPALGPAYLGGAFAPFCVYNDPNRPDFRVGLGGEPEVPRLRGRRGLLGAVDRYLRTAPLRAMDGFHEQAFGILSSPAARRAFDLEREPPALRDRYGRTGWGQQCLLARRLVEAGVDLVTVTLSGSEAGGAGANWDDHAVNCNIFEALRRRALSFDRCVTALLEDLYDRGLDRRVLLVVTGEFGRTPRISYAVGSVTRVRQPGRDHWPYAMSVLFAGGGIPGGQVVGATDRLGERPARQRVGAGDFLATVYRHLGVNAAVSLPDATGRPIPILAEGSPIPQLVAGGG